MIKQICVCQGRSCQLFGADRIAKALEAATGVTIEPCECLGHCSSAPNVQVNGKLHMNFDPNDLQLDDTDNKPKDKEQKNTPPKTGEERVQEIIDANNFLGDL